MDQETYINILFNDIGVNTRAQRNDWILTHMYKRVKYLDELSTVEKSFLIDLLKKEKYDSRTED